MKIDKEVYERGLALLNELHGGHSGKAIVDALADICPDYATATIQFGFGEIFSRPGLDLKTRELAIIASCVTLGHAMPQLKAHIEAALNCGATQQEIVEVIFQIALYAGFAAATNAMFAAKEVFAEYKKQHS
ncbi:MAG: carboxymuconolactone decarboxylase family protein [Legionellales bacterium]|nr:carboxymuconolactone decarboxylase family protein [Legionellales bacterium]